MEQNSHNEHDIGAYQTLDDLRVWVERTAHHVKLINGMELQKEAIKFLKVNNMEIDVYDFCLFLGIDKEMLEHTHDDHGDGHH